MIHTESVRRLAPVDIDLQPAHVLGEELIQQALADAARERVAFCAAIDPVRVVRRDLPDSVVARRRACLSNSAISELPCSTGPRAWAMSSSARVPIAG